MMDSSTLSLLCHEFIRLSVQEQNKEIGKLFTVVGGIRISRHRGEVLEEFRHRTFEKGLKTLPDDCEYQTEFFETRILPSLIQDFKESTVSKQERLLHKLSEVTDGASIKRKSGECDRGFKVRLYSHLLQKIPSGYEFEMMEFAKQFCESTFAHYTQGFKQFPGKVRRGNKVIPSLIEDFKESTVFKQERLLYKLSELTGGASIKRKYGESDRGFRVRLYSQLLQKFPAGNGYEMMEFAKQFVESEEDELDEKQYDQEDKNQYDDEYKNQYDDEVNNRFDQEDGNQIDDEDVNQYDQEIDNQYDDEDENQYDQEDQNQYDDEDENRYDQEDENRYDDENENQYDQEDENQYDQENDNQYDDEDENQYDQENDNQYDDEDKNQFDQENDNQYDDEDENPFDEEDEFDEYGYE